VNGMLSPHAPTGGLPRTYLMRAADALASATATYAVPLLVLVTTGSTALTLALHPIVPLATSPHEQELPR
jgi:hypothetical protein